MDCRFPLPKTELFLKLASPLSLESVVSAVSLDLVVMMIEDSLTERAYLASMAELHCAVESIDGCLRLRVSGFSDKAGVLVKSILHTVMNPDEYVVDSLFRRQSELLCRRYANENMKAETTARNARLLSLRPSRFSAASRLLQLQSGCISCSTLNTFVRQYLSFMVVDALIMGNVSASDSVALFTEIFLTPSSPQEISSSVTIGLSTNAIPIFDIVQLPVSGSSAVCVAVTPANPLESNVCVEMYYQMGKHEIVTLTQLELLEQVLSEPFFDSLRTKQQVIHNSIKLRSCY